LALHLGAILGIRIHTALVVVDNIVKTIQPVVFANDYGVIERFVVKIPDILVITPDEQFPKTEVETQVGLKALLVGTVNHIGNDSRLLLGLVKDTVQRFHLDKMGLFLDINQNEEAQSQHT
jgi:hypothetical protein